MFTQRLTRKEPKLGVIEKSQAGMFFDLMTARHKKAATIIKLPR
jgi:hypothetical protein